MNKALPARNFPILIVLSYWKGDKELCEKAIDLMVDLQPHHVGTACEVLLTCRQDSRIDQAMVDKLKTRFNTKSLQCMSPQRGWPSGSNGMFGYSMRHVGNALAHYDCAFWMEADCVPMYCNWFVDLHNEWMKRPPGVKIVGCKCDANGNGTGWHITGCALYDPKITRLLPEIATADTWAWDWGNRDKMLSMGSHTNAIGLRYKATNASESDADGHFSVIHGFKDASLIDIVRKKRVSQVTA